MITVEEHIRIQSAWMELMFAAEDWGVKAGLRAPQSELGEASDRKRAAERALKDALKDVTDWSTAPVPVGKDA